MSKESTKKPTPQTPQPADDAELDAQISKALDPPGKSLGDQALSKLGGEVPTPDADAMRAEALRNKARRRALQEADAEEARTWKAAELPALLNKLSDHVEQNRTPPPPANKIFSENNLSKWMKVQRQIIFEGGVKRGPGFLVIAIERVVQNFRAHGYEVDEATIRKTFKLPPR